MGFETIIPKAMLISKSLGQKCGINATKDVFSFVNKKGESCIFTVMRDEFQRPVQKVLMNKKNGGVKTRTYTYKKYTYENGETVPYKEVVTKQHVPMPVPVKGYDLRLQARDVIATVSNGEKQDVTKTMSRFFQPELNGNIFEKAIVARFSNGKKPAVVECFLTRNHAMEVLSKKTYVQNDNGNASRIISDFFYNTVGYPDLIYKREIISMLKSEMGLKEYGVSVVGSHRGYTCTGVNDLARYSHKNKKVSLNIDVPWVNTRKGFASEVSHELLHSWQYREIELLDKGLLTGARKEAAQVYKKEFSNYIKSSDTNKEQFALYEQQVTETKAREFQEFVEKYYSQNLKNIYNKYVLGIIPPQIGITTPLPKGKLKDVP